MARAHPPTGPQPPSVELIVRRGPQPGQRFSLTRPTIIIGRAAGNDVVVSDSQVSRRHASLTWDGRQHIIQDLGSANGTFVNGVRLTAPRVLQQGDAIGLGPTVLLGFQATLPVVSPGRPEPVEGLPVAKRRGKRRVVLPLLAALLGLGCLVFMVAGVAVWFYYDGQRRQAINDRPLVLIQAPLNREQIPLGAGVLAHATARAESGVARVELWADGVFVTARENPSDGPISPLVLSAGWEPTTLGLHTLLVRAISAQGVKGQASVAVEVVEVAVAETAIAEHVVQEGETLESIAEDVGVDVEELEDLNPDLDPEGPRPGEVVHYPEEPVPGQAEEPPERGAPPSGAEPSPAVEPPPVPHDAAPGSFLEIIVELVGLEGLISADSATGEPTGLRAEVLALEADGAYESLHCYADLGGGDPRWYPDEDLDQATYESFAPLGGGSWDVAAHLSGEAVPVVFWPGDQPLPIEITCVGIVGGGTDPAVELGRLEINVRPEAWDGITRRAVSEGGEGSFALDYRVSQVEPLPIGPQAWIDPSMTPPTNVRIDGSDLVWDYARREDEAPIDGFRIYLDDTLQWVEPPDARTSRLPSEWFRPPCDVQYRFTVTAFRHGFPDGPESPHSDPPALYPPDEPFSTRCEQEVRVTFHTLTTGELNVDGQYEDRTGDVGPVYGNFYVNERLVNFDGRCSDCRYGYGFHHNSEYDVNMLTTSEGWHGTGPAGFWMRIPDDEGLVLGFDITDSDSGNPDDDICAGEVWYSNLDLQETQEGSIQTDSPSGYRDRCVVSYMIQPSSGGPVSGYGGAAPLPRLRLEDLSVQEETGLLRIHVVNDGLATWTDHDLDVELTRHSGDPVLERTWERFRLEPGESAILQIMESIEHPLDVCVALDPENKVTEEGEPTGAFAPYRRYCRPLPDLTITDVLYDAFMERLLVRVENGGEGSLEHRDVSLQVTLSDGGTLSDRPVWRSDITLERWDAIVLEWPGIGEEQRTRMMGGYTVTVDAVDSIAETDEGNNEYVVPAGARLRLAWTQFQTRYYPRSRNSEGPQEQTVSMEVSVVPMSTQGRLVAQWTAGPFEVERGELPIFHPGNEVEFDIAGDEDLTVFAEARMKYRLSERYLSWDATTFHPENEWGVDATISEDEVCGVSNLPDYGFYHWLSVFPPSWQSCGNWYVLFVICRVE